MPGEKSPPEIPHLHILVPPVGDGGDAGGDNNIKSPFFRRIPSPFQTKKTHEKLSISVDEISTDNPDLGPYLLKLSRYTIASGESPNKALDYAIRASKSFERNPGSGLELPMSLHVVAAIYCRLGRFEEAIPILERSIEVPDVGKGPEYALAKYSGYMQLGDTYTVLGQLDRSISCYESGLMIQIDALTESDPKVAETCRYLAEAYVQAMQFTEAKKYCKKTLEIHKQHSAPASPEEATDRRLMALICEALGDYESALEHLVLASMAMIAHSQDNEVAAIDVSIGDIYSSLCRFDEAIFAYQKALVVFKSTTGGDDNNLSLASVFIRLAELYSKTGKVREAKSYCDNALRIYTKPSPGTPPEEISSALVEISAIYESVNETDEAFKVLQKAMKVLDDSPSPGHHRSSVAGIEAEMGVMLYMVGRYEEARNAFEGGISKLRGNGERKTNLLIGILLNQMGLACIQLYRIEEAVKCFEEARVILEDEYGPCHSDTLGVCSNLAAAFDAMGRVEEAIEILEDILKVREEMLGTANPEVNEEKKRLEELLKEAGRPRNKKQKSLQTLLAFSSSSKSLSLRI